MQIRIICLFIAFLFAGAIAFEKAYYLGKANARVERLFKLIDEQSAVIKVAQGDAQKYQFLASEWESISKSLKSKLDSAEINENKHYHINHSNNVFIGN